MTSFDRYLSAIEEARGDIDRHGDDFARLMQQRLEIDEAAFHSDSPTSLLMAATTVVARQAAADFIAMNRFSTVPAEAPLVIEATANKKE